MTYFSNKSHSSINVPQYVRFETERANSEFPVIVCASSEHNWSGSTDVVQQMSRGKSSGHYRILRLSLRPNPVVVVKYLRKCPVKVVSYLKNSRWSTRVHHVISHISDSLLYGRKTGKLGAHAMKRLAAGAHLPKCTLYAWRASISVQTAKRPPFRIGAI